ncbi:hypothetical protein [Mucilaginibacter sp. SP1R1]|uniref:hypothetical protein n=1 Tax=Mucilaginibacter sp. SP1R1 TaxID=2723091 RepID=UPI0016184352|nr:hypothetical protein [Mucilaginibacter sp. SP1R1]MBB6149933.1 hypothetical protein [Mucilaginibacter sp. SP1R1]
MKYKITIYCLIALCSWSLKIRAQQITKTNDSAVVTNHQVTITVNYKTGLINYHFSNGVVLNNTVAYLVDVKTGYCSTSDCRLHQAVTKPFRDSLGKGVHIFVKHIDNKKGIMLLQQITLYHDHPYLLVSLTGTANEGAPFETRDICPLAVLPKYHGSLFQPGAEPRLLDVPFDNDNWVNVLECKWDGADKPIFSGISYEYAAVYDNKTLSGLVVGSVSHDFWKTGIVYRSSKQTGLIDSLKIYGGAATEDNPALKPAYGGLDGTHDHVPHGTMTGAVVNSPVIYLNGLSDVRKAFTDYGHINASINGRQTWKGNAPVYWNSFGVEGVLGYSGVMMPKDLGKIADFIQTLDNFNRYSKPVLSIDSYDQSIYTTDVLASFGKYAEKKNQQMGFYFIPFAIWSWKNSLDNKIAGSPYALREAVLRDKNNQPILYKDGDWCAYAMDPTHPAIRLYIINQLEKAKAIGAKFIKIDFLTAGALESATRFNPKVRSGLQAYNYGMKTLRSLVDSVMGPDIFITQAISPMFPSQYAHTRFISTDVYSHLRDDQAGFPHYGSTEASLATGSHLWWVQGTLWPYTNLDVSIMKQFQKNPELSEKEVKVRLYAMMAMGSILGDGSDFGDKLAADRAKIYLNNKNMAAFFSNPKAFTPLKFADGETLDQQLSFYLPAKVPLLSLFNFDKQKTFTQQWHRGDLNLGARAYLIKDFLTDAPLGKIAKGQDVFSLTAATEDALLVKLVPVN